MRKYVILPLLALVGMLLGCGNAASEAQRSFDEGKRLLVEDKQYNEAAEQLLLALSLQDETVPTELLARTYEYISKVYWEQDFNDKALDYAHKGLACVRQLDNDSLHRQLVNRLASSYYMAGIYDTAHIYYDSLSLMSLQGRDTVMLLNAINNIGAVLISNRKPEEALEAFERGLAFSPHRQQDDFKYHYNRSRCFQNLEQWDDCAREIRFCMHFTDSTDLEGLHKLYRRLYVCKKNLGALDEACTAADSAYILADEAFKFKRREELKDITEQYQQQQHETELKLLQTHWMLLVVNIVFISLIVIVVVSYRNKKRTSRLQQSLQALKVQIVREEASRKAPSDQQTPVEDSSQTDNPPTEDKPHVEMPLANSKSQADSKQQNDSKPQADNKLLADNKPQADNDKLQSLYAEQFRVARDLFRLRPTYNKLRQLRYHTDKSYLSDEKSLPLIDGVTEVFIDPMNSLRSAYPELTPDECLYAVLTFLGCSNAVISAITKTSEPTLRKRRSRFKQKISEQLFAFLMEGEQHSKM